METKLIIYVLTILLVFSIFGCNEQKKINENETLARAFIEAWSTHDGDKLVSLFSDDCVYENVPGGRKYTSKKEIAGYLAATISGAPDTEVEIISVHAGTNSAFIEWNWKGTNTIGWPSAKIPATNKYFEVRGASIIEIRNDRIYRNSDYWDMHSFLRGIEIE